MRRFVSEWETCIFCSLAKVRQNKVETEHGWQQFSERVGPGGSHSYGDVCPTWFPLDQGYTELSQGMSMKSKRVAA